MSTLKVLLCCGAGMSSGFLAQKARAAAKKKNMDISVEARSESVISDYLTSIDVLLVGPHYETAMPRLKAMCEPAGVPVALIPQKVYAQLNGEAILELAVSTFESKTK